MLNERMTLSIGRSVAEAGHVVGRKPLLVDGILAEPGEPIFDADSWLRVESWVRTGRIVPRS